MDPQDQPPTLEPATRRGEGCCMIVIVTLLMLITALLCELYLTLNIHPHM
jgi:hypothetical protein